MKKIFNILSWILLAFLFLYIVAKLYMHVNKLELDPKTQTVGPMKSGIIIGQNIPEVKGYVDDSANIIDTEIETSLTTLLTEFAKGDKGEIAILTVQSMNGLTIEEFAIRVGEKWKVGKAGVDNGVIIIVALNEKKVRIETGRGSNITDAQAGQILDNTMVPKLKKGDWNGAIVDGTNAIIQLINK